MAWLASTLQTPCTVGMVCLFVEGAGTVQGHAGLHLFTAPGPLPVQAPRSSECLLSLCVAVLLWLKRAEGGLLTIQ